MALTTRTLPALMNGISQQPPILRSFDQTQDEADGRGDRRVTDELHDARACDAQTVADRRIAAIQPDHRRTDQRR